MGMLVIITLPLMFISNIFFPLDDAPPWLNDVAKAFPFRRAADGLQVAFDPRTHGLGHRRPRPPRTRDLDVHRR